MTSRQTAAARSTPTLNGLTLLALIAIVIGLLIAYRTGVLHGRREPRATALAHPHPSAEVVTAAAKDVAAAPLPFPEADTATIERAPLDVATTAPPLAEADTATIERARLIRSYEGEASALRRGRAIHDAELVQLRAFADERRTMFRALADARTDTARYRQIVVDLENNAPPALLDVPGSPDDLKLIVGIGPVLERMLHQLGIGTYRQIARWTEYDIDEIDAKLPEFPGRIRRDAWVTQARELHLSKYGERP